MRRVGLMICLVLLTTSGLAQKVKKSKGFAQNDTVEIPESQIILQNKMLCMSIGNRTSDINIQSGGGVLITNLEDLRNIYELLRTKSKSPKIRASCNFDSIAKYIDFNEHWVLGYPLAYKCYGILTKKFYHIRNKNYAEILVVFNCQDTGEEHFLVQGNVYNWWVTIPKPSLSTNIKFNFIYN